jgi:hypothetical protein
MERSQSKVKYPYPRGQKAADEAIAMIISAAGMDENPEDEKIELAACKMAASLIANNVKNQPNIVKDADKLVAYLLNKNDGDPPADSGGNAEVRG